jgi:hypothetical protein
MRTALWGMVVAGSTLAGWLSLSAGCGLLPTECFDRFTCLTGSGGGPATTTTTTTTSGAGGDSGPPPQCVPELMMGAAVADTCGIFVSSSLGNDTAPGVGSKAVPYKTLAAAVAAADTAKTRVYACAESFTESVTLSGTTGIFGALDCAKGWIYVEKTKAKLTAAADTVPLTLSNTAPSVELVDLEVTAADAVAEGGSSIAIVTDAITASLTRCALIAGNGAKGADGMMLGESPGPSKPTDLLIAGNNGADACSNAGNDVPGGAYKENALCMLSANPIGGSGGDGTIILGKDGGLSLANDQTAVGGFGQPNSGVWSCAGNSTGNTGLNGGAGMDGAGAIGAASLGKLTLTGYVGVAGQAGVNGKPGQGGGGGGGAKGKAGCGGASGGGGGAGGCGGLGGTGGKAGGASLGLVSLGATLSFTEVTIKLGTGGDGGNGGEGHSGRIGGTGGVGGVGSGMALSACRGGDGGQGGFGGQGGGGRGGHAIGIAASGATAPSIAGVTVTPGTPGAGGKGGTSQDGDPGLQANVQAFP